MKSQYSIAILLVFLSIFARAEDPAFWKFAPTPPMGWNSYDVYGDSVTEAEVLANASYMQKELLPYGWNYIIVDFRWYDPIITYNDHDLTRVRTGAKLAADKWGRLLPCVEKFPSAKSEKGFKSLADKIHSMGLKFGVHMMRGIPRQAVETKTPIEGSKYTAADAANSNNRCGWCPDMFGVKPNEAGQDWYDSVFRLAAEWGLDFVKVDDLSNPYSASEIEMIRKAIDKCGRPIVFSTSPGQTPPGKAAHISQQANQWRISSDFWDEWDKLNLQFDLFAAWDGVGGPGHWPDGDMIPFGHIGIRCYTNYPERWTRFTKEEQKMLMTLWCIAPSPLMLGMNLPDNDAWTLQLLTNREVIAINQDPLGKPASWVLKYHDGKEVWMRDLKDGSKAVALFNRGKESTSMTLKWTDLGLSGKYSIRDLWLQKDLGTITDEYSCTLPPHGSQLLKIQVDHR